MPEPATPGWYTVTVVPAGRAGSDVGVTTLRVAKMPMKPQDPPKPAIPARTCGTLAQWLAGNPPRFEVQ